MSTQFVLPSVSGVSAPNGKTKQKGKVGFAVPAAERVIWMGRTSDVFGSMSPDGKLIGENKLDASMNLIRRKIQERVHNTQELMSHIRRLKIGQNRFVTPNEFRATLLKFGINLSPTLVDQVFAAFDTERSGTMDFDDFAMWIMNAEFHPNATLSKKKNVEQVPVNPIDTIRTKLSACVRANPSILTQLKKRISFLDLLAEFNRKDINISESELRAVFLHLEEDNSGVIDISAFAKFAGINTYENHPIENNNTTPPHPNLEKSIFKICGKNTTLIEKCFAHIPRNEGVRLGFEEFRRSLLSAGLGQHIRDTQALFLNLGGEAGEGADMDLLFRSLKPFVPDPQATVIEKVSGLYSYNCCKLLIMLS